MLCEIVVILYILLLTLPGLVLFTKRHYSALIRSSSTLLKGTHYMIVQNLVLFPFCSEDGTAWSRSGLFFSTLAPTKKEGGFGWLQLHNTAYHSAKISGLQFIEKWDSGRDSGDKKWC